MKGKSTDLAGVEGRPRADDLLRELQLEVEKRTEALRLAEVALEASRLRCRDLDLARSAADERVRLAEARLARITDSGMIGMLFWDEAGDITQANDAFLRMVGYSRADLEEGRLRWRDITPPEFLALVESALQEIARNGACTPFEKQYFRKDGTRVPILIGGANFPEEGGRGVAFVLDITERKEVAAALRQSEVRHRSIVEAEPECVKVIGADGVLLEMNVAGLAMLEANSVSEVRALGLETFILPEYRAAFGELHRSAVNGQAGLLEFEVAGLRGTRRWLETHSAPLAFVDGSVTQMLAVSRDVTARKKAEAMQTAVEGQLRQSQKLESVGRLAGGVAHEFNNMLGVILGHAELAALQVPPSQPLRQHLTYIQEAAQRSASLTRQLLALARKQVISPRLLDLNRSVADTLSLLERLIGKETAIVWRPQSSWPVLMDPSQMDQIITNLCMNARDAIDGAGTITVASSDRVIDADYCSAHVDATPGEYVVVSVTDTGCGMAQATLDQIFEPFFTTKGLHDGSGLGLAMVNGAVRQNNGFVRASSVVGRGSTFEVFLPRYSGPVESQVTKQAVALPRGDETILLVDDEPAILDFTTIMLVEQGYVVLVASGPQEALRLTQAHKGPIHLLLTDIAMPGMGGRALAKAVRALVPTVKRLFMSGLPGEAIADQGMVEEGVRFLQKPFLKTELAVAVRACLDGLGPQIRTSE